MKNKDGRTAARQEVWSAVPAKGRTLLKYFPELTSAAASGKGLAKFAFELQACHTVALLLTAALYMCPCMCSKLDTCIPAVIQWHVCLAA